MGGARTHEGGAVSVHTSELAALEALGAALLPHKLHRVNAIITQPANPWDVKVRP